MTKVRPYITKQTTPMRKPISAEEYLSVTLRFVATGENYSSLWYQFRMSESILSTMVPYVCRVIYNVSKDEYFTCPRNETEWLEIAQAFEDQWQMPNCLGAGDGKHIRIKCPKNSGSEYFNYKGYYSLYLMAFVDSNYRFIFADVGCQSSVSDGGVFRRTSLWKALEDKTLNIPPPKALPQNPDPIFEDTSHIKLEHFFVCDDAFPLGIHIMKPYSKRDMTEAQRIFSYRLSRARKVSENAFGIMAKRFRILYTMMCLKPENAIYVVLACCVLHNMLMTKSSNIYSPSGSLDFETSDGEWHPGDWRESSDSSILKCFPGCKE